MRARLRTALALWLAGAALFAGAAEDELEQLMTAALAHNPALRAAAEKLAQFAAQRRALGEFSDPKLFSSVGAGDHYAAIPGATPDFSLTNNASSVQAGVEVPVWPGAYFSTGVMGSRLYEPRADGAINQTYGGAQVRVPLWRDLGFREQKLRVRKADAAQEAERSRYLDALQALRHDLELAYVACQEAQGNLLIAGQASKRAATLQHETTELTRLQATAQYQLSKAELEVALRAQGEEGAAEQLRRAEVRLRQLTGLDRFAALDLDAFVARSAALGELPEVPRLHSACRARGSYQALEAELAAAEAALALAREGAKSDISLRGYAVAQDDTDAAVDSGSYRAEHWGGAIELMWSRPLSFTGPEARVREAAARLEELRQRQRDEAEQLLAAMDSARVSYQAARQRLGKLAAAVDFARQTLAAEQERFRLGEGASRQVVDAQKDLNDATSLQVQIAAQLWRARADYTYATGAYRPPVTGEPGKTEVKR